MLSTNFENDGRSLGLCSQHVFITVNLSQGQLKETFPNLYEISIIWCLSHNI